MPDLFTPWKTVYDREVASFIGKLVSAFPGVEFGPLHYRNLESDKDRALKHSVANFEAKMTLSPFKSCRGSVVARQHSVNYKEYPP